MIIQQIVTEQYRHRDLQRHAKTKMHCEKMKKLNPQQNNQTVLSNTIIITNEQKELDLGPVVPFCS